MSEGSFSQKFLLTKSIIIKKPIIFMLMHEKKITLTCSFMLYWDFTIYNSFYYKSKLCVCMCVCVSARTCAFNHKNLSLHHWSVRVWGVWFESTHTQKKSWVQIDYPRSPDNAQSWHNDLGLQMWARLHEKGYSSRRVQQLQLLSLPESPHAQWGIRTWNSAMM